MTDKWKNGERIRMNILFVIRLIGAVFFLSILPVLGHALTPSQVFDKVRDAVVVVKTLDAEGKLKAQGSGVLLASGRVATNCHVVEGGASYQVSRATELVSATLYAEDGDKDICILDARVSGGKPAQLGKAAGLKVGDPVYAVGAPKGLELSLSDGIVAQLRGGPPPFIQTTAAISPGSSGGGLFDGEGRLVGLTTLYVEGGQSLNFAIPVEWIGEVKPGRKNTLAEKEESDRERTIILQCDGTGYFYEKGFGEEAPIQFEEKRIIKIDFNERKLQMSENKTARLNLDDSSFEATLSYNPYVFFQGAFISEEKVYVNRYTGECSSTYVLISGKVYVSFIGQCKRTERKF